MISFFATQKPFNQSASIRTIQENAILSWLHLPIEKEIILLGDDGGVAEFAQRYGLKHVKDLKKSTGGFFRIDDLFAVGEAQCSYHLKCFINSDIILTGEFADLIRYCDKNLGKFLCVGSQFDIDLDRRIDFIGDWKSELMNLPSKWRGIAAKDYFFYSDSIRPTGKPFAVGIPGWDCWVLQRALETDDIEVIDCSVIPTFHQNHQYLLAGKTYSNNLWWKERGVKEIREEYFKGNWKIRECKKILKKTPDDGFELVDNPFKDVERIKKDISDEGKDAYLKNIVDIFLEICNMNNFKVIVYGAGGHTKTLFETTSVDEAEIVGIGDKFPKSNYYLQYKLYPMTKLKESGADVVLISSMAFQERMEDELYRLYGNGFYYFTCYP